MEKDVVLNNVVEREITKKNGFAMLFLNLLLYLFTAVIFVAGLVLCIKYEEKGGVLIAIGVTGMILSGVILVLAIIMSCGLKVVNPNEAMVFTLFGQYYGTIKSSGFYFVNPFCVAVTPSEADTDSLLEISSNSNTNTNTAKLNVRGRKKISTKVTTLNNKKQKVNDALGNPIIIGAVVIWKIVDPTKAVLNVDNYMEYLSTQCDSTIRNISRLYPYDIISEEEDDNEKTLRGSSQEIAASMEVELQKKVEAAGIEILEVRITHLSYAEEIAAAMLQRQQATAIIAARQKIVEGAVSMVKMAIDQLGEEEIVVLDEERKAAMVSNLLVVLCGNKEAQPIVNSGSIY